jgi:hypothetical protein
VVDEDGAVVARHGGDDQVGDGFAVQPRREQVFLQVDGGGEHVVAGFEPHALLVQVASTPVTALRRERSTRVAGHD